MMVYYLFEIIGDITALICLFWYSMKNSKCNELYKKYKEKTKTMEILQMIGSSRKPIRVYSLLKKYGYYHIVRNMCKSSLTRQKLSINGFERWLLIHIVENLNSSIYNQRDSIAEEFREIHSHCNAIMGAGFIIICGVYVCNLLILCEISQLYDAFTIINTIISALFFLNYILKEKKDFKKI